MNPKTGKRLLKQKPNAKDKEKQDLKDNDRFRVEAFQKEYCELRDKHGIELVPFIEMTPYGILPKFVCMNYSGEGQPLVPLNF